MSLGSNYEIICKREFIEAMRKRLEAEKPGMGENVDNEAVASNLGALGEALFIILTSHAKVFSESSPDDSFWKWISDVNKWLTEMRKWQKGVADIFTAWNPVTAEGIALKTAFMNLSNPGDPPASGPDKITGKIK